MPQRSSALGRLPSTSTSLTSSNWWKSSCPSGRRRSSVTQRLLRLTLFQTRPMPSLRSPHVRIGSPDPGCSTLMTSAPNSPSAVPTIGPANSVAASMTRRPSRGPGASGTDGDFGTGQAQMVAQRRTGVALAEHSAPLQLRYDEAHDVLVRTRHMGRGDDEAVASVAVEPLLHLVGDVRGRPHEARPL